MANNVRDLGKKEVRAEGNDRNWRVGEARGPWKCVMNDHRGQEFVGFTPNSEIFSQIDPASSKNKPQT